MSPRVVDPEGVKWEVAREWFTRPVRSEDAPDPGDDILEDAGDRLSHLDRLGEGAWWLTVLALVGGLVVSLIFFIVLPLLFALVGVLLALGLLVARLLSISGWRVTARSSRARLEWRVRGTLRSARAVREIAAALERGEEWPLADGRPSDAVDTTPV
jgi:hypothetical protein